MGDRRRWSLGAALVFGGLALAGAFEAHGAEADTAAGSRHPRARGWIIRPNPRIDATSSYTQHKVPFSIDLWRINQVAGGWFTEATAYADFDGDGQVDIAAMPVGFNFEPRPPVILTGIDASVLSDITDQVIEGARPELTRGYRALVADFNGDGRPDLYFASADPPSPAGNALLLSTSTGKLRWARSLVEPAGFHAGVSAADIDNDGDIDIFVSNPNYFLVNHGRGYFTIDYGRLPTTLGNGLIIAAELIDVDRDGYLDLLVGGHEFDGRETAIFWGGPSGLRDARVTVLPPVPGHGVVLDVEADDLDGDGRKDVVVTRTKDQPFYDGYYFQLLRQTRRRVFADESQARIIGDPATWPGSQPGTQVVSRVRMVDVNGDGALDLVLDDRSRGLGWVNDGQGHFTAAVTPDTRGSVAGTVVDGPSQVPLPGVEVNVFDAAGAFVTRGRTDAAGDYLVRLLAGSYYVTTTNTTGYLDELFDGGIGILCPGGVSCDVRTGQPVVVAERQDVHAIDFALEKAGSLSGAVTDVDTLAPIAGVTLTVFDARRARVAGAETDALGRYSVGPLRPGTYFATTRNTLGFVDELFGPGGSGILCPDGYSCDATKGHAIVVRSAADTPGIDFSLERGGFVSGTVADATTGATIAGIYAQLVNAAGQYLTGAATDAQGRYVTAFAVPAGSYFSWTQNSRAEYARNFLGYVDELYDGADGIPCPGFSCRAQSGQPVPVVKTETTHGIDFHLDKGGTFSGSVTDAASGAPLAGVRVEIYTETGQYAGNDTKSDASGQFSSVVAYPSGRYYAKTRNSHLEWAGNFRGYVDELYDGGAGLACPAGACNATAGQPIQVTADQVTSGIGFSLARGGTYSGTVRAADGTPLAGVRILTRYLAGDWGGEGGVTDSSGRYTSDAYPPGSYLASTINDSGLVDELYDGGAGTPCPGGNGCTVTSGRAFPVDVGEDRPGIDFTLDLTGGDISGRVTDAGSGTPLARVRIVLYGPQGEYRGEGEPTGSDGSFRTRALPAGGYFVRTYLTSGYTDQLYLGVPCPCIVTSGHLVNVVAGQTTPGIDFALAPAKGSTISGHVLDAETQAPLSNIEVDIHDSNGGHLAAATTDFAGNYSLSERLQPGEYYARTFNRSGHVDELYDGASGMPCPGGCDVRRGLAIHVVAGQDVTGIDFDLDLGGKIAGRVSDASNGAPLAGAIVEIYGSAGQYVVNFPATSTGEYTSPALPPGSYFANTRNSHVDWAHNFLGYVDELYDGGTGVTCPAGSCNRTLGYSIPAVAGQVTGGIAFGLERGGTFSGTVRNAAGTPLPAVMIHSFTSTGTFSGDVGFTDLAGHFTSDALPAGSYFATTGNSAGLVDELYDGAAGLPCPGGFGCSSTSGRAIPVSVPQDTTGVGFVLDLPGERITGTVTDAAAAAPLPGVRVVVYDAAGQYRGEGPPAGSDGTYATVLLPAGGYFVRTIGTVGYTDQLHPGIPCPCVVTSGHLVNVAAGQPAPIIDFALARAMGSTLSGRVVDAANQAPLVNVDVAIHDSNGGYLDSVTTDAGGNYAFSQRLQPGDYYARTFNRSGYADELYDGASGIQCAGGCDVKRGLVIHVVAGQDESGIDFGLERGGTIAGRVTDADTGAALPGVFVQVFDGSGQYLATATADAGGIYATPALRPGSYLARSFNTHESWANNYLGHVDEVYDGGAGLSCPGFFCNMQAGLPIAVWAGQGRAGIDFALQPGGAISGRVVAADTGEPIPGVFVNVKDASGRDIENGVSDAEGHYTTDAIPPGSYVAISLNRRSLSNFKGYVDEVYDGASGVACKLGNCNLAAGLAIPVGTGSGTGGIDFRLDRGGSIAGAVMDDASLAPIPYNTVLLFDSAGAFFGGVFPPGVGGYATDALPPGSYFLTSQNGGEYADELYDGAGGIACPAGFGCAVSDGVGMAVAGQDVTGVDFRLSPGGRIAGRITDEGTGQGVAGIGLLLNYTTTSNGAGSSSNASGAYVTSPLPPGDYLLRTANAQGYINEAYDDIECPGTCPGAQPIPVPVTAGATTPNISFALRKGGTIAGRVTDEVTGAPLPGVVVEVFASDGTRMARRTSAAGGGYAVQFGLPPGTYFAWTRNTLGFVDELWSNIPCPASACDLTTGTPIVVPEGESALRIDFPLRR